MVNENLKDENLKVLIIAVLVYFWNDGYFNNEKGVFKHYELDEVFTKDELTKVRPYINLINNIVNGFPNSNVIPKIFK